MVTLYDAARLYNAQNQGFGAGGGVPSPQAVEAQMAGAIEAANRAGMPAIHALGGGFLHEVFAVLKHPKIAPDYAHVFEQALLKNTEFEGFVKQMEFALAAIAERSPETWQHLKHHAALSLMFYQQQHGAITPQKALAALEVTIAALGHDVGKLGLDPHLLHKNTRLAPERFESLIQQYAEIVPDYPQKTHDLQFLREAQFGKLVFLPDGTEGLPTKEETIAFGDLTRSESHLTSPAELAKHNHILTRIEAKALAHISEIWLNPAERAQLASSERGTITPQEKAIINSYDAMSEAYFAGLDRAGILPPELKNLPKIVNMDAFRGQAGDAAPESAKLIHLTDVFEALTANRSYRAPYNVSEALRTMDKMAQKGEIDRDMLKDFVKKGVWFDYANVFGLKVGDLNQIQALDVVKDELSTGKSHVSRAQRGEKELHR